MFLFLFCEANLQSLEQDEKYIACPKGYYCYEDDKVACFPTEACLENNTCAQGDLD